MLELFKRRNEDQKMPLENVIVLDQLPDDFEELRCAEHLEVQHETSLNEAVFLNDETNHLLRIQFLLIENTHFIRESLCLDKSKLNLDRALDRLQEVQKVGLNLMFFL